MTDHRKLQRTLFRMQLDPGFAVDVFARDTAALRSTGLTPVDVELLLAADPRAVGADPGGRRLGQLVGNVVLEFSRTVHLAVERLGLRDFAVAFARSSEFHDAIRRDRPLPLAFASYALRRLAASAPIADPTHAVLALETALARARRTSGVERRKEALRAGEVVRAPTATLVRVPDGTLDLAARISAAADDGAAPSAGPVGQATSATSETPDPDADLHETLLVVSRAPASGRRSVLREVEVERLSGAAAALLASLEHPRGAPERAALAAELEADPAELEAFVESLVADGVVLRGAGNAVATEPLAGGPRLPPGRAPADGV